MAVFKRVSVDFVVPIEAENQIPKYVFLLDKNQQPMTEGEVYFVSYEDENGYECDESGVLIE